MQLNAKEKAWLARIPDCPKCNSRNGWLGTSGAYFSCNDCGKDQYWTKDNKHRCEIELEWPDAIGLSPYGRTSELYTEYLNLQTKLQADTKNITE